MFRQKLAQDKAQHQASMKRPNGWVLTRTKAAKQKKGSAADRPADETSGCPEEGRKQGDGGQPRRQSGDVSRRSNRQSPAKIIRRALRSRGNVGVCAWRSKGCSGSGTRGTPRRLIAHDRKARRQPRPGLGHHRKSRRHDADDAVSGRPAREAAGGAAGTRRRLDLVRYRCSQRQGARDRGRARCGPGLRRRRGQGLPLDHRARGGAA